MLERLHVLECKLQSLFSKEGGPPIIMGPLGLRTAVRAVAGCQYPHSPALRMRTATSFDGEHAQINLKDRAPAHLIDLTSKVGEEQLRRQTVICHQMPALPSALDALATTARRSNAEYGIWDLINPKNPYKGKIQAFGAKLGFFGTSFEPFWEF